MSATCRPPHHWSITGRTWTQSSSRRGRVTSPGAGEGKADEAGSDAGATADAEGAMSSAPEESGGTREDGTTKAQPPDDLFMISAIPAEEMRCGQDGDRTRAFVT